jgi:uncharacterized membrane protein
VSARPKILDAAMLKLMTALTTMLYPFVVYFALDHTEPRFLALILAVPLFLRWLGSKSNAGQLALLWPVSAVFLALTALINRETWLLAYPILVNSVFLALFAFSLYRPPSAVERLARLREPDLSPSGVAYTRQVTQVWCGFFLVNGFISAWTLWHGDRLLWSLYNGCIAYVLMGTLMASEWALRQRLRSRF